MNTKIILWILIIVVGIIAINQLFIANALPTNNSLFKNNNIQASHNIEAKNILTILQKEGYECNKLIGSSMQPTNFEGNSYCSIPYNTEKNIPELKPGMIITYTNNKGIIAHHRIVSTYNNTIAIQGDNNPSAELINKTQVLSITLVTVYT